MAAQKRKSGTSIKEQLFDEFYRFSFFKAVDLLTALYPEKTPLGQASRPSSEVVRFSVKPDYAFPASDIVDLEPGDTEKPAKMTVNFMGLIGPSGVLPSWYNETAMACVARNNYAFTAFLDIFHHRLISLFYLAWKKYRLPENTLPAARGISQLLMNLAGFSMDNLKEKTGIPDESFSFFCGFFSNSVTSAAAMESAISCYAGTQAKVEQFITRLIPLDKADQTSFGIKNSRLGYDILCGDHIRECGSKFRVHLGPMDYDHFHRFLPNGDLLSPLFSFIKNMVGIEYEFDIRVYLTPNTIKPCMLGAESTPNAPRLGWSSCMTAPDAVLEEKPFVTFQEKDIPTKEDHGIRGK